MRIDRHLLLASSLLVAVLALPAPVQACGGGAVNEITFLGWTKDSRLAAYQETIHGGSDDDETGSEEAHEDDHFTATLGVTVDGRSGEVRRYLLKLEGKPAKEERAKYAGLPRAAAFRALEPFAPLHRKERSPNGTRRVLALDQKGKNRWEHDQGGYAPDPDEEEDGAEGSATSDVSLAIEVAGEAHPLHGRSASCSPMGCWSVSAYWSPDGQQVAWVDTHSGAMGYHETFVYVQRVGLSVQVLSDKGVSDAQRGAVEVALKKLGVEVLSSGETRDPRTRSVVYFQKGNEKDAAAVAQVVPGGAATEPLTWKSQYDVVLALAPR